MELTNLQLHNNNLTTFLSEWKFCLQGMRVVPSDSILEVLFNKQVSQCDHIQPILNIYHNDVNYRDLPRSYQSLLKMVEKHEEREEKSS